MPACHPAAAAVRESPPPGAARGSCSRFLPPSLLLLLLPTSTRLTLCSPFLLLLPACQSAPAAAAACACVGWCVLACLPLKREKERESTVAPECGDRRRERERAREAGFSLTCFSLRCCCCCSSVPPILSRCVVALALMCLSFCVYVSLLPCFGLLALVSRERRSERVREDAAHVSALLPPLLSSCYTTNEERRERERGAHTHSRISLSLSHTHTHARGTGI